MPLLPRDLRRDILSTWARVPEIDSEGTRWLRATVPGSELAQSFGWSPTVDLSESDGEFVLTAELPGVSADDVMIDVEDGVLSLKGEKKEARREENKDFRLYERQYGSFERRFTLPRSADPENATASFENGVLSVHLPKKKEAMGRKIEIQKDV